MTISIEPILRRLGVRATSGEQLRPVNRDDLLQIIKANGGSARYLYFDGLDFTGADLRGLDLSDASFNECNFSRVDAYPLIVAYGNAFPVSDSDTQRKLGQWARGELNDDYEVVPTRIENSFLMKATLHDALFDFANMKGTYFNNARAQGTGFFQTDFTRSNFAFARFIDTDLRRARFCDANLYAFHLETNLLDSIDWGNKHIILHEKDKNWDDAISTYVMLARVHELAGMADIAGELRYRLQMVRTGKTLETGLSLSKSPREQGIVRRWLSAIRRGGGLALAEWFSRWFIDFIFGYGERPWRVIRAILLTLIAFSLVYFDYSSIELSSDGVVNLVERAYQAMYFSAASSTALGYGSWVGQELGWVKYLGAAQSFLGTFLTALFLVTFTRRWTR